MLYQLSYASTGKPSKIITQAIKLQATFCWRQNHCQTTTYRVCPSTSRALSYSYSHFSSITVSLLRLALRGRRRRIRGWLRRRLRKLRVRQLHVVLHFSEVNHKRRAAAGLAHRKRQFHSILRCVVFHVRLKFRQTVRRETLVDAAHQQSALHVEIHFIRRAFFPLGYHDVGIMLVYSLNSGDGELAVILAQIERMIKICFAPRVVQFPASQNAQTIARIIGPSRRAVEALLESAAAQTDYRQHEIRRLFVNF